ncbi:MAG: hypothetical protein GOV00_00525 [Candidatus Altiarchaeota archaeon]|nr:hypothetical protein [Candidatus Altiarchaeota archaeon]
MSNENTESTFDIDAIKQQYGNASIKFVNDAFPKKLAEVYDLGATDFSFAWANPMYIKLYAKGDRSVEKPISDFENAIGIPKNSFLDTDIDTLLELSEEGNAMKYSILEEVIKYVPFAIAGGQIGVEVGIDLFKKSNEVLKALQENNMVSRTIHSRGMQAIADNPEPYLELTQAMYSNVEKRR